LGVLQRVTRIGELVDPADSLWEPPHLVVGDALLDLRGEAPGMEDEEGRP
jgi:hypothetical protein